MTKRDIEIVMTGAELAATRAWLGVSRPWLAQRLGQSDSDLARMERGKDWITYRQRDALNRFVALTLKAEDDLAARLSDQESPAITVPRADGDRDTHELGMPAGWWLALAGRLQRRIPALAVSYSD